jgi:hypothetical protein
MARRVSPRGHGASGYCRITERLEDDLDEMLDAAIYNKEPANAVFTPDG